LAEDIERRLADGEERGHACMEAGRTLAIPLLASSLVIILRSPFLFREHDHQRIPAASGCVYWPFRCWRRGYSA
jgi:hypothetical protein